MADRWLSLLGAITGLTALGLQLWQFVLSGARIKLRVSQGISTHELPITGQLKFFMLITIANHGRIPATVENLSIELAWEGDHIPLGSFSPDLTRGPSLPVRVDSKAQVVWSVSLDSLLEMKKEGAEIDTVRALATLSDGTRIRSIRFLVNPNATGGPLFSPVKLKSQKVFKFLVKVVKGRKASRWARKRITQIT